MSNLNTRIKEYYKHMEKLSHLNSCLAILYQDMETNMPAGASNDRWEQVELLSKIIHNEATDSNFWDNINYLFDNQKNLSGKDKRSVFLAKKTHEQLSKVPTKFIGEFEKAKSITQNVRHKAKKENNYPLYKPHLKKVFEMTKKYANYINPNEDPYNVLLDIWEEWCNIQELRFMFWEIKEPLQNIIRQQSKIKKSLLKYKQSDFPQHQIALLCKDIVSHIWFDLDRGNIWEVNHPCEITISGDDIRINTNSSDIISALTSIIHELGHGLYEQNINKTFKNTNLYWWASLWLHESQSRFLENIIWRSKEFLSFILPLIKKQFSFVDRTVEELYNHLNKIQPSLIRTEADEVTYNLHIILRFEIEQALLAWKLSFEDLPTARNEKMKQYIWVRPKTDSEWCMQDVHWAAWLIWYFPSYTIWNILWAQLQHSFSTQNPNRKTQVKNWDFSHYLKRFKTHIRQYGSLYSPKDLIYKATWEQLQSKYFLDYINTKIQ